MEKVNGMAAADRPGAGMMATTVPSGLLGYASNTGTRRSLAMLAAAGWRILITPSKPKPPAGFRYGVDNGAWTAHQQGTEFDGEAFARTVDAHGLDADWVVLPDIVAGGDWSLDLSVSWMPKLRGRRLLLAVQDGMDERRIMAVVREYHVGIFVGGSTEYKLRTMAQWSAIAASMDRWCHVGRVNTVRRIRLCAESGVTSFDGTGVVRFPSVVIPRLDAARRQPSLLVGA